MFEELFETIWTAAHLRENRPVPPTPEIYGVVMLPNSKANVLTSGSSGFGRVDRFINRKLTENKIYIDVPEEVGSVSYHSRIGQPSDLYGYPKGSRYYKYEHGHFTLMSF